MSTSITPYRQGEHVIIRSERPGDYAAIARVNALAFGGSAEPALVALLRATPRFDPGLSLVALVNGEIVGHALFVVYDMRIGGATLKAAELAPLAVHPDHQKCGIGAALLAEGHRRARLAGCALAYLLGHPSYYPRHGYIQGVFGSCRMRVARARVRDAATQRGPEAVYAPRALRPSDVPALMRLWRTWFDDVDLAVVPDEDITGWLSTALSLRTVVFDAGDGQPAAYLRYDAVRAHTPRAILARDADAMAAALFHLEEAAAAAPPAEGIPPEDLILPLHPRSAAAGTLMPWPFMAELNPWAAAMILPLDETCAPLNAYLEGVADGTRPIGLPLFGPAFDPVV